MKRSRKILLGISGFFGLGLLLVVGGTAALYLATLISARGGEPMLVSQPFAAPRSTQLEDPLATTSGPAGESRQILFGDLHVHTNYSGDSFLQSYELGGLDGRRTPADSCDFARFCSQLDFWSINDHAESLTPEHWQATLDAVRGCDTIAGGSESPDLVSFLGWEWSHSDSVEQHYGHKNVILADLADELIPSRPIGSGGATAYAFVGLGTLGVLASPHAFSDFSSFHRYALDTLDVEDCATDVPSPELPRDCRETARTPQELFSKLSEWGKRALVIPHGLAWGTTNPTHARLDIQLEQHDPRWQPLLEVYSGHGNSEVFADFERPKQLDDGRWTCPAATDEIEFCCERAGTLVRERCEEPQSSECEAAVTQAVQRVAEMSSGPVSLGSLRSAIPGTTDGDWGECGQLRDSFLRAYNYRPRQSAQYALALESVDGRAVESRFRWGLIASSDNHRGRPGTGYKEFGRLVMSDGAGYPGLRDMTDERSTSSYYTGGLAAVHAPRRDREAIFGALSRRETYGTSGDRILLWFDATLPSGARHPMGSEVELDGGEVRFEVRAVGARKQRPGCPEFVEAALPAARIASLCLGECFNPSDERKRIERIEVVRVTSSSASPEGASMRERIEDPWRVFECPESTDGCTVEFSDQVASRTVPGRNAPPERSYYVRAIQEASPAINGDPVRCERDASGRCIRSTPCGYTADGRPDDCLSPVGERAWSSPIWVRSSLGSGGVDAGI